MKKIGIILKAGCLSHTNGVAVWQSRRKRKEKLREVLL